MKTRYPILYSFRRCPYAIRARLAIKMSQIKLELREVVLADKPSEMLTASPKATVPVLVLPDGTVIDESIDIMYWALNQHDPGNWLSENADVVKQTNQLVNLNDNEFKLHLDHYKYADRFPDKSKHDYRKQGEVFLQQLESLLSENQFLLGDRVTLSDIAIFPFVRQFAFVDKDWFEQSHYKKLQQWLENILKSDLFKQVMIKRPQWKPADEVTYF